MKRITAAVFALALLASSASAQPVTAPVVNNSAGQKIGAQPTIAVNESGVYAGPGAANMTAGSSVVSALNSTATPLGAGIAFTGPWEDVLQYADVRLSVFSNVASATDGLQLQYSSDGVNTDSADAFTTTAGVGKLISFSAVVIAIQQGITGIPVIVRWVGHAAVGAWTFFSKDVK